MRIPSRHYVVGADLRCAPRDIHVSVVQDHVMGHPFGLRKLFGHDPGTRRHQRRFDEGWEAVTPPVLTSAERLRLTTAIKQLEEDGTRCAVPRLTKEVYGGDPPPLRDGYCLACLPPLISRCATLCHEIAERYFGLTDRLLGTLDDTAGIEVSRRALFRRVPGLALRAPRRLDGLVVLALGLGGRRQSLPIARVNAWDGVRTEFVVSGSVMRWRTTYGVTARSAPQVCSLLLDLPHGDGRDRPHSPLASETCLVPRSWWEETGDVA